MCHNQLLRAHKIVLSASSKFFRDLFKHQPLLSVIDLDKELSPNGLDLSYADVQLIIGILYCVGTVEISPQRIQSLLLIAQVLGIPTLITLLKRIKSSIPPPVICNKASPPVAPVALPPPPSSHFDASTSSAAAAPPPVCNKASPPVAPPVGHVATSHHRYDSSSVAMSPRMMNNPVVRPSAPLPQPMGSSTGSFGFSSSTSGGTPLSASRKFSSGIILGGNGSGSTSSHNVLDAGIDPSFLLSTLGANQIDDLESALLPHLHRPESLSADLPPQPHPVSNLDAAAAVVAAVGPDKMNRGSATATPTPLKTPLHLSLPSGFCKLTPQSTQRDFTASPVQLRPQTRPPLPLPEQQIQPLPPTADKDKRHHFENIDPVPSTSGLSAKSTSGSANAADEDDYESSDSLSHLMEEDDPSDDPSDEDDPNEDDEDKDEDPDEDDDEEETSEFEYEQVEEKDLVEKNEDDEISVNLNNVDKDGKSFKFAIPGSASGSVTLNFSAEALNEMRKSYLTNSSSEVSSSTQIVLPTNAEKVDDEKKVPDLICNTVRRRGKKRTVFKGSVHA